ncbi:hypothetical protein BGZ83_009102 [Gryganskiella cystojenkinii]|nr:hypothetical protein BGZ83_009102 [Gryganskiella cystojenkinii]
MLATHASSSDEDLHHHQHGHHKESLTEEQVFGMMVMHPPPSIGQREDYYRQSPTLTASQTLAATYGNPGASRPESPFQSSSPYLPYQSYQPYSHQLSLPSPMIMESGYGVLPSPVAMTSPGLSPFYYSGSGSSEERPTEHKADPYRSAYSAARDTSSTHAQGYGSPYLGGGSSGSPNMNEDFSSSFESRFSSVSRGPGGSSANNSRYPLHILAGQDSSQALSTAYYEHQHLHLQQQLQKQQQKAAASAAAAALTTDLKTAGDQLEVSSPGKGTTVVGSPSDRIHPSQPSKTDSSGTKKAKTETDEDEENDMILQKLGVISVDSSGSRSGGTRSGLTQGSGRSRRKGQWTDESEEESQERGGRSRRRRSGSTRQRRSGRPGEDNKARCCCCSRKICVWISLVLLACLAVSLYFLIPRAPEFMFQSVTADTPPVVGKSRFGRDKITEPFKMLLTIDSTNNYLALRVNRLDIAIFLQLDTEDAKIADNMDFKDSSLVIEPRTTMVATIPMSLEYRSTTRNTTSSSTLPSGSNNNNNENNSTSSATMNSTDVTFQQLIKSCTPVVAPPTPGTATSASMYSSSGASQIPGLDVMIHGQLHIWGLSWVWKPSFNIHVESWPCPANAPNPDTQLPTPH